MLRESLMSPPRAVLGAAAAACAVLALAVTACAGGSSEAASEPGDRPAAAAAARRVPSGLAVLATKRVVVPPAGTRRVPIDFEQAPSGSLLVLGPRARDVSARFRGTRLVHASLLGTPALTATIEPAGGGELVVQNPTRRRVRLRVVVAARTARSLSVETPAEPTAPGTPVEIRITLRGASASDVASLEVRDDTRRMVVFRTHPRQVGPGRWATTFTPVRPGDYTAAAWVGPSRPRSARSYFWVTRDPP